MRALEQRTVFSTQRPFDIQKGQLLHRERIRSPKKSIDNDEPYSCTHNVRSVKLELLRQARQAEIKQQNAHLANRIYKIMASPGGLHTHLHAPVPQLHSTNYSQRVRDAMRIHNDNMTLARKLESVEPHYTSVAQYSPRAGAKPQASAAMNADRYARQLECLNFLAQKNPLPSHHKTVYSGTQVSQQANLIFEYAKLQGSVYIDVKVYHGAGLEFDESALAAEIGERNEGRNTSSKPQSSPLPPSNSKPSSGGGMGRGGRHLVSTINSTQVTGDDAIDL
eukprot:gene26123-31545_t